MKASRGKLRRLLFAAWGGSILCTVATLLLLLIRFPNNEPLSSLDMFNIPTTFERIVSNGTMTIFFAPPQNVSLMVHAPFPRWAEHEADRLTTTKISLDILTSFVRGALVHQATTVALPKSRARYPEILYVVTTDGLWVSRTLRQRSWNQIVASRVVPTEALLQAAQHQLYQNLEENGTTDPPRWPHLTSWLRDHQSLPLLLWYGDYKECNNGNWKNNDNDNDDVQEQRSVPLFTACAPVLCTQALLLPAYSMAALAKETPQEWNAALAQTARDYPWDEKIHEAVWRGSLSGPNEDFRHPRWLLCLRTHAYEQQQLLEGNPSKSLFDVGLTEIPSRHDNVPLDLASVGGLVPPIAPMQDFARYKAVLDVDGNAWSSRFPALLCLNSIVLKVEPAYVDMTMQDVWPWVHYVPVAADASDVVARTAWALDPANDVKVQTMVAAANAWCQTHLVRGHLAERVLDVWETYVTWLDERTSYHASVWETMDDLELTKL